MNAISARSSFAPLSRRTVKRSAGQLGTPLEVEDLEVRPQIHVILGGEREDDGLSHPTS